MSQPPPPPAPSPLLAELLARPEVDCDSLLRLARDDTKQCQAQLKDLGITQVGPRMRLLSELRALNTWEETYEAKPSAPSAPSTPTMDQKAETKAANACATIDELRNRGCDVDALARIAQANAKACHAQLKELGISQMGVRARLITELVTYGEQALGVPMGPTLPGPTLPGGSKSSKLPGGSESSKLLAKALRLKERGNESYKEQNHVAACEAYREGIEAAEAARAAAPSAASKVNPVLVALHSNICLCLAELKQYRVAIDNADAALEIDGDHVKARLRRGSCLLRLGMPQDGRRSSDEPKEVRMARKGHLDQAKADFLHVAKIEPNNREVRPPSSTHPTQHASHAARIPRSTHPTPPRSRRRTGRALWTRFVCCALLRANCRPRIICPGLLTVVLG